MFLEKEDIILLTQMFAPKWKTKYKENSIGKLARGQTKMKVGIGEQIIKFKGIKEETKNGRLMYIFSFWKAPVDMGGQGGLVSYDLIQCYHIVGNGIGGNIKDCWYKKFTTSLTKAQLESMREFVGKDLKALIGHEYSVYHIDGKEYPIVTPYIVDVKKTDDIFKDIEYFKLVTKKE